MSEDSHSHFRLDPSDRLNGLGQRRKRPKKVSLHLDNSCFCERDFTDDALR